MIIPYEIIGKITVGLLLSLLFGIMLLGIFVLLYIAWHKLMDNLTHILWYGHRKKGEGLPPEWRLELSFYTQALKNFDLTLVDKYRDRKDVLKRAREE